MAAPTALRCSRHLFTSLHAYPRYSSHSASPATGLLKGRILPYLYNHFYDMESFIEVGMKLRSANLERKNETYINIQERYGDNMAAAVFALVLKGGIRFQGQTEWYREHKRRRYSVDLVKYLKAPLEAMDVSGSIINYNGLGSLANLKGLKYLDLSRCPNVDDWSLSRLHAVGETLEELSLAGCPQITEKGLACLHHLENLRRLDVSDLPSVPHKGLIQILLEEMLPQCDVVGLCSDEELALHIEPDSQHGHIEDPQEVTSIHKNGKILA